MQVLGAGGALGGPARPGVNYGGKKTNLGAAPHDWGFAKKSITGKHYSWLPIRFLGSNQAGLLAACSSNKRAVSQTMDPSKAF